MPPEIIPENMHDGEKIAIMGSENKH